jgi:hypothetical protein
VFGGNLSRVRMRYPAAVPAKGKSKQASAAEC